MSDLHQLIAERRSSRVAFDAGRRVSDEDLRQILEAGRWAPTAHNMQNFDVIVVDDHGLLDTIGTLRSRPSPEFIRENHAQLSFSAEELRRKGTGLLVGANAFPPSWTTPGGLDLERALRDAGPSPLSRTIHGAPTVLVVTYDASTRAPASQHDVLGFISLGCVMQNMWLTAHALGLGFQVMSVFADASVEPRVRELLGVPDPRKIAFAVRLGYPVEPAPATPRVRRELGQLAHRNRFGEPLEHPGQRK